MRLNGEAREILMRVRFTESNVHTLRGGHSCTQTAQSRASVPLHTLATFGRARGARAVARTPARRFCATRPCTLRFSGHVAAHELSAVWSVSRKP
eukprot:scaffold64096_cov66-Phaeocystis_antarctica.AAC.2